MTTGILAKRPVFRRRTHGYATEAPGLATGAVAALGAMAGCALPGSAGRVSTVFDLQSATIPVVGQDAQFPVRRIYCIGCNHAAHAREMGSDPTREPPFFPETHGCDPKRGHR